MKENVENRKMKNKLLRLCSCHNKRIKEKDTTYFDGSFTYFCSVNGEYCDTIIKKIKVEE